MFLARYPGRCGLCDEPFHEGDEVEIVEGQTVHADCADDWLDEE